MLNNFTGEFGFGFNRYRGFDAGGQFLAVSDENGAIVERLLAVEQKQCCARLQAQHVLQVMTLSLGERDFRAHLKLFFDMDADNAHVCQDR